MKALSTLVALRQLTFKSCAGFQHPTSGFTDFELIKLPRLELLDFGDAEFVAFQLKWLIALNSLQYLRLPDHHLQDHVFMLEFWAARPNVQLADTWLFAGRPYEPLEKLR